MSRNSKISMRKFSAQAVAVFAVAMAAAWTPLSHSLRVAVTVESETAPSCRLVLASACDHSKQTKKSGAQKNNTKTERIFNAVPESLESSASIHFDIDQVPARSAPLNPGETCPIQQIAAVPDSQAPPQSRPHLPRGPPQI